MNEILLMLPGPTTADPRVLQAMGKAVVNHRGDEFGEIYTETTQLMSKTFQTENDSYILTGSGTSAWRKIRRKICRHFKNAWN